MTTFNIGPDTYTVREWIGFYAVVWSYKTADFAVYYDVEMELVSTGHRTRAEAASDASARTYGTDTPSEPAEGFPALGSPSSGDLMDAANGQF